MKWTQISINTCPEGLDHVTAKLLALGFPCVEIEDESDFKDYLENNRKYWDYVDEKLESEKAGICRVKLCVTDDEAGMAQLRTITDGLAELSGASGDINLGSLEIELFKLDEEDWGEAWKKFYKPIPVGERIIIKPDWEELPGTTDRIIFKNDPGMSFGTGDHESTRLCIESLEKNIRGGMDVLDVGCGSGILFIIALLLGAGHATALDIDHNAVKASEQNAKLNDINKKSYRLFKGDILEDKRIFNIVSDRKYDVITANIVSDVIIKIAPLSRKLLKKGGKFIVSGIISERCDEVRQALSEHGFSIEGTYEERGWNCIVCTV